MLHPMIRVISIALPLATARRSEFAAKPRQMDFHAIAEPGQFIDGRFQVLQRLQSRYFGHGGPEGKPIVSALQLETTGQVAREQSPKRVGGTDYGFGRSPRRGRAVGRQNVEPRRTLGSGQYGITYLAKDESGDEVVLKVLRRPQEIAHQRVTSEECEVLKRLRANSERDPVGASRLVTCKENHIYDQSPGEERYIVLEYGGMPVDRYPDLHPVAFAKQMLQGVRFLAMFGISHRDIKPPNALVTFAKASESAESVPIIKIIDFGLYTYDITCENRANCGDWWASYYYAPPEMRTQEGILSLNGDRTYHTDAFDVWSIAYTTMELMCGKTKGQIAKHGITASTVDEARGVVCGKLLVGDIFGKCSRTCDFPSVSSLAPVLGSSLHVDAKRRPHADVAVHALCSFPTHMVQHGSIVLDSDPCEISPQH